ncbi:MAG: hypothetical protein LBR07_04165 [Puniceicoccales bacterium]|jgi:hypothetical protein|nr:hypothetical protein [Puniceicoccales bacterium]
MFNIYDQANRVTYPDLKAGYWQQQLTPEMQTARDCYEQFPKVFGAELDTINSWGAGETLAAAFIANETLFLARVHNGGSDAHNRPQRWVVLLYAQELGGIGGTGGIAPDLARWLDDPRWPFAKEVVPLPAQVPETVYAPPALRGTLEDSILPTGGALPATPDAATSAELDKFWGAGADSKQWNNGRAPKNLAELSRLWAEWQNTPRRAPAGSVLFSTVGGVFKCKFDLRVGVSDEHKRRKDAERRRLEEEARKQREKEEVERRRRIEEERKRREEAEAARQRAIEEKRRLREAFWKYLKGDGFIGVALAALFIFVAGAAAGIATIHLTGIAKIDFLSDLIAK